MFKKRKKYKPCVPPPVPEVTPEYAQALEKSLRAQADSWATLQQEPKKTLREKLSWIYEKAPGIRTILFDPRQRKKRQQT